MDVLNEKLTKDDFIRILLGKVVQYKCGIKQKEPDEE